MGFLQKQPVDPKKCKVELLDIEPNVWGIYIVEVGGNAKNYSYGFYLTRDTHFVGGIKIDSMGWTGPLGKGTKAYQDSLIFEGHYLDKVIISGSNGNFPIPVEKIETNNVDEYIKSNLAN